MLLLIALAGCNDASSENLQRLKEISASAKGHLGQLLRAPVWSGDRLRMSRIDGDVPVMESVGKWKIELIPDPTKNMVHIQGLLFAKDSNVTLDMDRDILAIDGQEFVGRPVSGNSPMFKGVPFAGVNFERLDGRIFGYASIIFTEDGRTAMDFDKVFVDGSRAREYGILSGD
jgi:hypothetical protein